VQPPFCGWPQGGAIRSERLSYDRFMTPFRPAARTCWLRRLHLATLAGLLAASASAHSADGWVDLFNGRDLTGWTPKITGYPLGENFGDTFRVEDGLLKVRYDAYDEFDGRFGHLFWEHPYSHYHLLIEYRFTGAQVSGGPGWAARNSGVMFHAQTPESMTLNQDFPVSIEGQFLGGLTEGQDRPTGNVCTPGTDIVVDGRRFTPHCLNSSSPTLHGDQWVRAEFIVRGSGAIRHLINGEEVLAYERPTLSDRAAHAKGGEPLIEGGYLALQSESHPIDFRVVKIRVLTAD
jgi:hypothetical protein